MQSAEAMHAIYIPLCFYFIYQEQTVEVAQKIFTFHYASTLSKEGYSITA